MRQEAVAPEPSPEWWEPFLDSVPGLLSGLILALVVLMLGWRRDNKNRAEDRAEDRRRWELDREQERSLWLRNETMRMTSQAASSLTALLSLWGAIGIRAAAGGDPLDAADDAHDDKHRELGRWLSDLRLIGRSDIADALVEIRVSVEGYLGPVVNLKTKPTKDECGMLMVSASEAVKDLNRYLDGLDLDLPVPSAPPRSATTSTTE